VNSLGEELYNACVLPSYFTRRVSGFVLENPDKNRLSGSVDTDPDRKRAAGTRRFRARRAASALGFAVASEFAFASVAPAFLFRRAAFASESCHMTATIRRLVSRHIAFSWSGGTMALLSLAAMSFRRKPIRLHPLRYVGQLSYFITFCCARRRPVFADARLAAWFVRILREHANVHRFAVHAYCVMPDHFHALLYGLDPSCNLLALVKTLKQTTAHEYQQARHHPLWQKRFYDHILRPSDNAAAIAGYIWMNPVRKGLCKDMRDYPHSGSFVVDWKKAVAPIEDWVPAWKPKMPA
jgi:putative transposase